MKNIQDRQRKTPYLLVGVVIATVLQIGLLIFLVLGEATITSGDVLMDMLIEEKDLIDMQVDFFNFLTLVLSVFPFIDFVAYFLCRGKKRYRKMKSAEAGVYVSVLEFVIILVKLIIDSNNVAFAGKKLDLSFGFNLFGHLYWIILLVQCILIKRLSASSKGYREYLDKEERLAMEAQEKNSATENDETNL